MARIKPSPAEILSGPYRWFNRSGTWTNTTAKFIVLVGIDGDTGSATAYVITITSPTLSGNRIDSFRIFNATAAGFTQEGVPRRMLVPPGCTVTTGGAVSAVVCDTLKDALLIL